jgi:hypothetical protein
MTTRPILVIALMLASWPTLAQTVNETPAEAALRIRRADAENRALFQSDDPLEFTLEGDFGALSHDRDPESTKKYPGIIRMSGANNAPVEVPVQLSARGHLRRNDCNFVPLRVEFAKDAAKGTVFEMRGASLKLVTHCQNSKDYEQYVLKEYMGYRIARVVTVGFFRARLARVTYVDSDKKKTVATRYAIFLEDDDDVARRLEGKIVDRQLQFTQLHPVALMEMVLFEYMIGNTDFSIYLQHNVRVVESSKGLFYPVPYDFDASGLVNVPYAGPDPRLHIKYLTDRTYRGPCRTPQQLEPYLKIFRSKKLDALAAVDAVPDLTDANRRQAGRFIEGFFSIIDKPSSVKSNLIDHCLKTAN